MAPRSSRVDVVLKQTKVQGNRVGKNSVKQPQAIREAVIKLEVPNREQTSWSEQSADVLEQKPAPVLASEELNLNAAITHLCSVDSRFGPLFEQFTPIPWTTEGLLRPKNHFRSLVLGVMSQQVSGAAARSIGKRFVALFLDTDCPNVDIDPEVEDGPKPLEIKVEALEKSEISSTNAPHNAAPANAEVIDAFPAPEQVAASDVLYLKSAGLSLRKAEYVKGIAEAFVSGVLNEEFFATENDENIRSRLVSIRGLGPWSAEMFMMFSLNRWNVISPGDIGIQRGMSYWIGKNPKDKSKHHKNKASKYMTESEMISATHAWQPYRSIGCWAMWRVDGAIDPVAKEIKEESHTQAEAAVGLGSATQ